MKNKKLLIALNTNISFVALTLIGMLLWIFDARQQNVPYVSAFRYYTVLSNLFLAITSGIMFVYFILLAKKKVSEIPKWVYIVKLCGVTATTITFLIVVFVLTPGLAMGVNVGEKVTVVFLYTGGNLIFHLITPILAIVSFLLFETRKNIKLPQITFSLIFTGLYEIFYTTDVYLKYLPSSWGAHDWYGFAGTVVPVPVLLILYLGLTFLVAWLLWLGNRKIHVLENKTN